MISFWITVAAGCSIDRPTWYRVLILGIVNPPPEYVLIVIKWYKSEDKPPELILGIVNVNTPALNEQSCE